jgi:hypothetical protein
MSKLKDPEAPASVLVSTAVIVPHPSELPRDPESLSVLVVDP